METWIAEYRRQLEVAVVEHPDEYDYGTALVPEVVAKMRVAFAQRAYGKDTPAIKACCKALGIKRTYKDIERFIANHA